MVGYGSHTFGVGLETIGCEYMSQVLNLLPDETTLGWFDFEFSSFPSTHHRAEVSLVFLKCQKILTHHPDKHLDDVLVFAQNLTSLLWAVEMYQPL